MLVLTCVEGGKVMIGDEVNATALEASTGRVKLNFEAPDYIPVHRLEIWQSTQLGFNEPRRSGKLRRGQSSGESPDEAAS